MTSRRFLPALLLLFIGSGCAALIYEIVWFQLLQLVIGSSAISLGVLLGTFMGGMCLGSFVLSSVVSARHHPLRVYAGLELGIALIGLLVLVGMPLVSGIYTSWAGSGVAGLLFRGVIASVCLLPPTLLMGATLPAISRWVEATPEGVSWLGFFYGGNIAGAVAGSVLTGFYLLRVFDVSVATYVAVCHQHPRCARRAGDREGDAVRSGRGRSVGRDPRRRLDECLRRHRALGHDGARRRSDLDPDALAAVRRQHVYLLAHPGRLPVRARHRQQRRLGGGPAARAAAHRPRLVPGGALRLHGVGGVHAHAVAAVLAAQSLGHDQSVDQFSGRCRPRALRGAAGRHPLGRQLSARAGCRRRARPGSRAAGRRRLRRKHRRRDRRLAGRQPRARRLDRHAARPAGADGHRRDRRRAPAARPGERKRREVVVADDHGLRGHPARRGPRQERARPSRPS